MASTKDDSHLPDGARAEALAQAFLEAQGLHTLAKNYRCKTGEIDLIMRDGNCLVFVEVRLRTNRFFTSAAESVTRVKQQKMIRTAQRFLQQQKLMDTYACRFDIIAFDTKGSSAPAAWIRDAFGLY